MGEGSSGRSEPCGPGGGPAAVNVVGLHRGFLEDSWEATVMRSRAEIETLPEQLRPGLRGVLAQHQDRFTARLAAGDLTRDEVDDLCTELACAIPLPIDDLATCTPRTVAEIGRQLSVIVAELTELKARVMALEEAR